jgi:hypothetical protein
MIPLLRLEVGCEMVGLMVGLLAYGQQVAEDRSQRGENVADHFHGIREGIRRPVSWHGEVLNLAL